MRPCQRQSHLPPCALSVPLPMPAVEDRGKVAEVQPQRCTERAGRRLPHIGEHTCGGAQWLFGSCTAEPPDAAAARQMPSTKSGRGALTPSEAQCRHVAMGAHVLVAVILLTAGFGQPELVAESELESLALDDECSSEGGLGDCSLSALQLRARAQGYKQWPWYWYPPAPPAPTCSGSPPYVPFFPNPDQDCRESRACCDPSMTCYEKGSTWAACMQECTPGFHYDELPQFWHPWSCRILGGAKAGLTTAPPSTTPPLLPGYAPSNARLLTPSTSKLFTFYMYRAMADNDFPPENVNAANLPGVMWYLHNEVVITKPRKFGITRIIRYKVQTRAPQPLADEGMNFGVRYAFDFGNCTGPYSCDRQWAKYGYFVGCNNLGSWPFPNFKVAYPGGIWYSLPGPCPNGTIMDKSESCKKQAPGGACTGEPTGRGDCTYSYEYSGEIRIDDLEAAGGPMFWDNPYNADRCVARVSLAASLFAQKYPNTAKDAELLSPPCDFDQGKFYS